MVSRSDRDQAPGARPLPRVPLLGRVVHRLNRRRRRAWRGEVEGANRDLSDAIYERIAGDEEDWIDYVRRAHDWEAVGAAYERLYELVRSEVAR